MSTQKQPAEAYQHKLSEAKRLINTHNYLRKPGPNDNRVVYEDFVSELVGMGGNTNEMLQRVTAEDLQQVCGLPVLMARRLAEIFKEDVELLYLDSTGSLNYIPKEA